MATRCFAATRRGVQCRCVIASSKLNRAHVRSASNDPDYPNELLAVICEVHYGILANGGEVALADGPFAGETIQSDPSSGWPVVLGPGGTLPPVKRCPSCDSTMSRDEAPPCAGCRPSTEAVV